MKKILFSIFLIICSFEVILSQTFTDSLKAKISSFETAEKKVEFLNNTSSYLRKKIKLDKAVETSLLAIKIVEDNNLDELYSKTGSFLGLCYRDKSDYIKSKKIFNQALETAQKLGQKTQIAYGYNNLATLERILSNYSEAIVLIFNSLEIFTELENIKGQATCYINLGILYRYQKQYDKSLEYLFKAKTLREKIKDVRGIGMAIYLVAETYFHQGEYNKALSSYNEAKQLYLKHDLYSDFVKSSINMALGGTYYELKEYEKALNFRLIALKIIENSKEKNNLARVYLALGKIYYKLKQFTLAEKNLNNALNAAVDANLVSRQVDINKAFAELYKEWSKHNKAFTFLEKYSNLKDDVYTNESKEEIARIESKFKAKEKESENKLLTAKLNIESQKSFFLTLLTILSFVLILVMFIFYRNSKKSNKLLKEINDSKDLFFSIISHDVKNPFGTIINNSEFLLSSKEQLNEQEKLELTKNIYNSSKRLNDLLENLLNWAQSQRGVIKVSKVKINLQEIVDEAISILSESSSKKGIKVRNEISNTLFVSADKDTLASVIRNLVNNAIKFSSKGEEVIIDATEKNEKVEVEVIDKGIGIDQENLLNLFKLDINNSLLGTEGEKGSGLGLIICKDFVEKNGGELWVQSEKGNGSTFRFSLSASN